MYELKAFTLLVAICVVVHTASAAVSWNTLNGSEPLVVARGGFSGIFPDSSSYAYQFVPLTSQPSTVAWCDVQLTKEGLGICSPDLNLDNSTMITLIFPTRSNTYLVNGVKKTGYFSIDFTSNDLANVTLTQGIYSRTQRFDGSFPILFVTDLASLKPAALWLNIQHDAFFTQHNLSMRSYVLSISKTVIVNYISSPEVNFLKSITARINPKITKLVFRFLLQDGVEPSTNQTYGTLLKNLTFIKTFASGILVPKTYIWPVDDQLYLLPHTSIVSDAHKVGLEVFASDFANDYSFSYNYSFDPLMEYVSFIDNGVFSVDGVVSDFPITPSAAIGCYAHVGNTTGQAKPLIISHNGASGDFPGCTDLAYFKAISDGAKIIDCSVQITKDGIPICLSSINLIESTTAAQSSYSDRTRIISEISGTSGIYTFDLTWEEIQTLTPQMSSPYFADYGLVRNPKFKNEGQFLALSDFLALAKNASSVSGVLIGIENAAYLAANQGIDIVNAVITSLSKAGYDNQTTMRVMIQSTNSSVLQEFKSDASYERVYLVDELIRDALNSTVEEIKSFANSVAIKKKSVYTVDDAFITSVSAVVPRLHSFNLPVYVLIFRNEFVSQAWDFFADSTVEINTFVQNGEIDGIITEFPKTAASYLKNKCLDLKDTPVYMSPVQPGSLISLLSPQNLPPAEAPYPVLKTSDVSEAPLPPVSPRAGAQGPSSNVSPPTKQGNAQPKILPHLLLSALALFLASTLIIQQ